MISSKAIDLIKTFSEDEFRKFRLYVSSPYFNREAIQVKFYGILKKNYPSFESRSFEKEKVFAKLYPGKKYNDGVMRNILSGTLELAQNFLAIESTQKNEFELTIALMRELTARKMEKLFVKANEKGKKNLEERKIKNEFYFYDNYLLLREERSDLINRKSTLYGAEVLIPEISDKLITFFIINILKSSAYIANSNKMMLNYDNDAGIINELEAYLEREAEKYRDITYIQYYYNAFKLAKTQNEIYFYNLKKIANSKYETLSATEKTDIFSILSNYCYYKINKGELKFKTEQFLIIKESIERGYHNSERGFLSHIQYLNAVITGIGAGEISWVENFIEQYKHELDNVNRENAHNFCCSLVYYHKKEYNDALNWAAKVKTDDLSYKHQLKSLYLKIYYDMNEIEPFYSHIDSYRHFLMNEKHVPELTRNVIGSYVSYAKKLFDIKNKTAERDFDLMKIQKEISDNKSMINKVWLLEKIEEIEKDSV